MTGPAYSERDPKRQMQEAEKGGGTFLSRWEGVIKQIELKPKPQAKGRQRPTPGTMNKTEAKYAAELEERQKAGEIAWWGFEAVKLRLADKTFYTPDFVVMYGDGRIELVEVKGFWEDDARVKIKVAAAQFWMFTFTALMPRAKKDGGGWKREEF